MIPTAIPKGVRGLSPPEAARLRWVEKTLLAVFHRWGFREILEMRRETRVDDYDLTITFPPPLVPRKLRYEVPERTLPDGTVRSALDENAARRAIEAADQASTPQADSAQVRRLKIETLLRLAT